MLTLRKAIDAKCKDCIYDQGCGGGSWREQIAQCSSVNCPLWPVRTGPESGPWAVYPTDPATVTREWLRRGVGQAETAPPMAQNGNA